ncbi:MAG: putative DNA modification/repair radical SAM protein [bacterium]|nr:putative DNA modification/repair radical SAM protein [bacterium]
MDTEKKISLLADSARFDLSCSCGAPETGRVRDPLEPLYKWIYPASLPQGGVMPVLKILMTNQCVNSCKYCFICTDKEQARASFEPEELSRLFMSMVKKRLVKGIFLSSASGLNVTRTMDKIIATAEILRFRHRFRGYVHLKILPGADAGHIEKALHLADRVSVNLEAPNAKRLENIARGKNYNELLSKIKQIGNLIRSRPGRARSQTTQFVVGAARESDKELLLTTTQLYKDYNLYRVYFSAFQPFQGTPLENLQPVPLIREHRLYQADFLLRKYGFRLDDIFFNNTGDLSLDKDPKTVWVEHHPEMFPLEVNKADLGQLIRIPGIGPLSARKLLDLRVRSKFRRIGELRSCGIRIEQARNYLLVSGQYSPHAEQMKFDFSPAAASSGGIQ